MCTKFGTLRVRAQKIAQPCQEIITQLKSNFIPWLMIIKCFLLFVALKNFPHMQKVFNCFFEFFSA